MPVAFEQANSVCNASSGETACEHGYCKGEQSEGKGNGGYSLLAVGQVCLQSDGMPTCAM